jgi:hypothetical protein
MPRKRSVSAMTPSVKQRPAARLAESKPLETPGCRSIRFDIEPGLNSKVPVSVPPPEGVASAAAIVCKIWSKSRLQASFVDANHYDPTGLIRRRIRTVVQKWSDASLGGINFDWMDQMQYDSDIRISLTPDGTFWSLVGTDTRLSGSNLVTLNLGFNNSEYYASDDTNNFYVREFQRLVLHEFGHALGFIHEHLSPKSQIRFNEPAAIDYFRKNGLGHLTDDQIREQVLRPDPEAENLTEFDIKSVMLYPFPASIANPPTDNNWELSAGDIETVRKAYPKGRRLVDRPGSPISMMDNPQTPYLIIADYPILFRFQAPTSGRFDFEVLSALPSTKNPFEVIGLIDLSDPIRSAAMAQGISFRVFREKADSNFATQLVEQQNVASKSTAERFASVMGLSLTENEFIYLEARNAVGHSTDWSRFRLSAKVKS